MPTRQDKGVPFGTGYSAEPEPSCTVSAVPVSIPNAVRIMPGPGVMTRGRRAYEADVRQRPNYQDGAPRRTWNELSDVARWSWEREPYPLPCAPDNTGDN